MGIIKPTSCIYSAISGSIYSSLLRMKCAAHGHPVAQRRNGLEKVSEREKTWAGYKGRQILLVLLPGQQRKSEQKHLLTMLYDPRAHYTVWSPFTNNPHAVMQAFKCVCVRACVCVCVCVLVSVTESTRESEIEVTRTAVNLNCRRK